MFKADFTLTVTCDLNALLAPFNFYQNPLDYDIHTKGEPDMASNIINFLASGTHQNTTGDFSIHTHAHDETNYNYENFHKFWVLLTAKCINHKDNDGLSANVQVVRQHLTIEALANENNIFTGELLRGIGTEFGKQGTSPAPVANKHWAAALAVFLYQTNESGVTGNFGSFSGDITKDFQTIRLKDKDSVVINIQMVTDNNVVGAIRFIHDSSKAIMPESCESHESGSASPDS